MAITKLNNGPMDHPSKAPVEHKFILVGDKVHEIKKVAVHKFTVGDAEDPDLYAAEPLIQWRDSEMGRWVMEKAVETPEWHRFLDHTTYGYQYTVIAKLKDVDYTFWALKWGSK